MKTYEPFNLLPCFISTILSFLLSNLIITGTFSLVFFLDRRCQSSILSQSRLKPSGLKLLHLLLRWIKASCLQGSATLSAVTALTYDQGLISKPVTVSSFGGYFTKCFCTPSNFFRLILSTFIWINRICCICYFKVLYLFHTYVLLSIYPYSCHISSSHYWFIYFNKKKICNWFWDIFNHI